MSWAYWSKKKVGGFGPILYTPPLDVYSGAKRAYGNRLLRTTYAGPLFQVRRLSTPAALMDVYPESNGLIDEDALLTWAGGISTVYEKYYDQSENTFDMQAYSGSGNVPFLFPTGSTTYERINGKLALKTQGGYFYDSNPFMYSASANSFIGVFQAPNTNASSATLVAEGRSSNNNPAYFHSLKLNSGGSTQASHFVRNDANTIVRTSNVDSMGTLYDNNPHIMYRRDNSSNFRVIIDNISDLNVNYTRSGVLTLDRFAILAGQRIGITSPHNDLKMGEIIFYDSNQDANATGLISTLNSYYGTH